MSRQAEYEVLVSIREELYAMVKDHDICFDSNDCPFATLEEAAELIDNVAVRFSPNDGYDGAMARKQWLEERL